MRSISRLLKFLVPLAVVAMLLAACSQGEDSPRDVVRAASQAFVEGYNGRDLSQFDSLFASPAEGGDSLGLEQTKNAAHKLVDAAQADETFETRSFEILWQKVDEPHKLATVHYRAEVSLVRSGVAVYAATVEQDVALMWVNGTWLIAGGDPPQITPTLVEPTG
jgi:hypothetical protein